MDETPAIEVNRGSSRRQLGRADSRSKIGVPLRVKDESRSETYPTEQTRSASSTESWIQSASRIQPGRAGSWRVPGWHLLRIELAVPLRRTMKRGREAAMLTASLDDTWATLEVWEQGGASSVKFHVQRDVYKLTAQSYGCCDVIECGLLGCDRMQSISQVGVERGGVLVFRALHTQTLCCTIRTQSPCDVSL